MSQKRITVDEISSAVRNVITNFGIKLKGKGTINFYNGHSNLMYRTVKGENGLRFINVREFLPFYQDMDEIVQEVTQHFVRSKNWMVTIIERVFTEENNPFTGRKIIELWGGYVAMAEDEDGDQDMRVGQMSATGLSNLMLGQPIPEDAEEDFGSLEDYIFRDYDDEFVCGWDLK